MGDDQVVLAPTLAPPSTAPATVSTVAVLEQVVVTGSASGAPSRRLPFALDVVDGPALGSAANVSVASALDGRVPGLWLWAQPPTAVLTRYGSVRGASSFGVNTPKLYLDGVEAANPLVVTDLPPERIARVEIIRGPQGAALYGADAINGVINVVTRHDDATGGNASGRSLVARGGVGGAGSDFAGRPAVAQDYALLFRTGSGARTAGLSLSASTLGAYAPGAAARRLAATGDLRRVYRSGTLTGTFRLAEATTSTPTNPLLAELLTDPVGTARGMTGTAGGRLGARYARYTPTAADTSCSLALAGAALPDQRLRQLTAGLTATRTTGGRWTHALTAGVDAYSLKGVTTDLSFIPTPLDTAQRSASGGAARATLRASSTATVDVAPRVRATFLALADYGLLRDATADATTLNGGRASYAQCGGPSRTASTAARPATLSRGISDRMGRGDGGSLLARNGLAQVAYLGSAGVVGQATLAVDNALFLTAGLRGERNDGFTDGSRFAALPSLGVAYVRPAGRNATLKLRGAYGSGLRPVRTATRATAWRAAGALSADLEPEAQHGVEAGVDVFVDAHPGRSGTLGAPTFALHATRFDQRARNLLQQIAVAPTQPWAPPMTAGDSARRKAPAIPYVIADVGVIDNRGWEFAGDVRAGPLSLAATVSLVDSRVRRLADGYRGDLRTGDRTLEVPRRTVGLTAAWQRAGWSATLGAARASDWVNYDRLRLAEAASDPRNGATLFYGDSLRTFWRTYGGVTRLSAAATREVRRGLTLVLTGDNLLDRQEGEPDNATIVPGRTVTVGVRARF